MFIDIFVKKDLGKYKGIDMKYFKEMISSHLNNE